MKIAISWILIKCESGGSKKKQSSADLNIYGGSYKGIMVFQIAWTDAVKTFKGHDRNFEQDLEMKWQPVKSL